MIKVGIIGCGKIADSHAEQIQRIAGSEIVGVCDKEKLMAKQLYERFPVKQYFSDANKLLELKPDIVHITTPPQSHFVLGKLCLEAGSHVYMEKPFTLNTSEAEQLIGLATEKKLKITVGHDDQFTHATRRMREYIKNGYLGGTPVHMESYYCYDLGNINYAKSLLGDKRHWVRSLPGQLLQNNISHGICRIAEFLKDDNPKVIANGFTSKFLQSMDETDIIDELRVIIEGCDNVTAYFTFSSQMRPVLHHFRVYGPKNALIVDHYNQTIIKVNGCKYKSYLDKFIPPVVFAKQYAANFIHNINLFLKRDFHMKSGMKYLIESFYKSVTENAPLPISYREILLTSKIMDSIFEQINAQKLIRNKDLATKC
ncbi:MAG: Gfo/Idh/MocA family oxidoreductase [Nitrospirae bacterium]|nr:Gfo/Idh/MocA family oxidoreductase [Nitrospirota bacterium]